MNTALKAAAVFGLAWLFTFPSAAVAGDGKKIFTEEGCVTCHAVSAAGITVMESEEAKKDLKEQEAEGAKSPPDLSSVGVKRDADFLNKYLRKKADIEGRKHKKRFKGSDADREVLVGWLLTFKSPAGQGK